jgi:hypothetical protein
MTREIVLTLARPTYRRTAAAASETAPGQVAISEPVVLHHGREADASGRDNARPSAATACWAAPISASIGPPYDFRILVQVDDCHNDVGVEI